MFQMAAPVDMALSHRAYELVLLQHRDTKERARAGELDGSRHAEGRARRSVLCCEVRQVKDLPAAGKPRETRFGTRKDRFIPYFREGRWRIVQHHRMMRWQRPRAATNSGA
jgi:hypothetical protein